MLVRLIVHKWDPGGIGVIDPAENTQIGFITRGYPGISIVMISHGVFSDGIFSVGLFQNRKNSPVSRRINGDDGRVRQPDSGVGRRCVVHPVQMYAKRSSLGSRCFQIVTIRMVEPNIVGRFVVMHAFGTDRGAGFNIEYGITDKNQIAMSSNVLEYLAFPFVKGVVQQKVFAFVGVFLGYFPAHPVSNSFPVEGGVPYGQLINLQITTAVIRRIEQVYFRPGEITNEILLTDFSSVRINGYTRTFTRDREMHPFIIRGDSGQSLPGTKTLFGVVGAERVSGKHVSAAMNRTQANALRGPPTNVWSKPDERSRPLYPRRQGVVVETQIANSAAVVFTGTSLLFEMDRFSGTGSRDDVVPSKSKRVLAAVSFFATYGQRTGGKINLSSGMKPLFNRGPIPPKQTVFVFFRAGFCVGVPPVQVGEIISRLDAVCHENTEMVVYRQTIVKFRWRIVVWLGIYKVNVYSVGASRSHIGNRHPVARGMGESHSHICPVGLISVATDITNRRPRNHIARPLSKRHVSNYRGIAGSRPIVNSSRGVVGCIESEVRFEVRIV